MSHVLLLGVAAKKDIPEMDKCMVRLLARSVDSVVCMHFKVAVSRILWQGKPKDVEVGKLYRSVTFKSRDEWIFFKVFSKEELAGRVTLNVFVNGTRPAVGSQPPFILLVSLCCSCYRKPVDVTRAQARELYTSGTVCPHPSKTFMRAESLNSKGEYKVTYTRLSPIAALSLDQAYRLL